MKQPLVSNSENDELLQTHNLLKSNFLQSHCFRILLVPHIVLSLVSPHIYDGVGSPLIIVAIAASARVYDTRQKREKERHKCLT